MSDGGLKQKRWLPLEANPQIFNEYAQTLGMPSNLSFHDVLSKEDWALEMLPPQCVAMIMLYPLTENQEAHRREEAVAGPRIESQDLWFTTQTVGNACGTVGMLHIMMNLNVDFLNVSFFKEFREKTNGQTPEERAAALMDDEAMESAHKSLSLSGQSTVPNLQDEINTHFTSFVPYQGRLVELDGRKDFPVDHGPTSPGTFLKDCIRVIDGFMERDPDEVRFQMMALCVNQDE